MKNFYQKWWFWVIIGVIIIGIVGSVSGTNNSNSKTDPNIILNETTNNPSTETKVATSTQKALKNIYTLNETFASDTEKITFTKYEEKWTEYEKYTTPREGYKIIRAYVKYENISSSMESYIYSGDFSCYANDQVCKSYIYANDTLQAGNISAGRGTEGWLYYEVPVNATSIEIECDFLRNFSNTNVTFKMQ